MSKTRKIVVGASVLAVVGIAAAWLIGREPSREWTPPVALDGRYEARYELTFDGRVPGTGRTSTHLGVRGKLDVKPLKLTEGARWFAARLTVEALEADDAAKRLTGFGAEGAADRLGSPWFFLLDDVGRVAEVRFSEDTPIPVRGVLSAIAWGTQLARPLGSHSGEWEAGETEINGPYQARYVSSWGAITKTWSIRTEGNPDDPERKNAYDGEGEARFEVAPAWIERVQVSQRGSVSVGGHRADDRARYGTAIALVRVGDAEAILASSFDPAAYVPFSIAQVPAQLPPPPGASFDSLLETARAAGEKKEWQKRLVARNDMTRLIADDDRLAERAGKLIRAGGYGEPLERTLIEALVGAASPAAQTQVAGMIGDGKMKEETKLRVLQATSLLKTPGPEIVSALEAAAFARSRKNAIYASQAAMALGAAVMYLQPADSPRAQHMAEKLVERAVEVVQPEPQPGKPAVDTRPTASLAERTNWIGALGNAGVPESLPILLALLQDPHATVRASAAHSLRFMDPVAALPAMERAMHEDPSITVRHALLHAARTMGPAKMEAFVTRALMYDDSEHVRLGAAYAMAMWAMKAPGLRRTMAQALENEKSPKVRESLRNYLQPGRAEWPFRVVPDP